MNLFFLLPTGSPAPLVLAITSTSLSGADSGASQTGLVQTSDPSTTTVSVVSGGVGPYTYAWTLVGGASSSGPFTPSAPSGAETAFSCTCDTNDIDNDEVWSCEVTDTGNNDNKQQISCTVTLTWSDTS